ncbi:MAG: tRNA pseudouridine(38-40) synthase TruA [Candidatus Promineifilaceae bacterium]
MRYCAIVEYDGTSYFGFQRQHQGPTIQSELEQAIAEVSGSEITILYAGRTDSGVHALGQVIAFDLDWSHTADDLHRALNAKLAKTIAIKTLNAAREDFHPRYDARRRIYEYNVYNNPVRSPHHRLHSWHIKRALDIDAMNNASQLILGLHDFSTFGQPPQGMNTVREVINSQWRQIDDLIIFNIVANAFLKRMVRSLVGTLKAVGDGSWTVKEFEQAFLAKDRGRAGKTAPACGLFLMSVVYDEEKLGD